MDNKKSHAIFGWTTEDVIEEYLPNPNSNFYFDKKNGKGYVKTNNQKVTSFNKNKMKGSRER